MFLQAPSGEVEGLGGSPDKEPTGGPTHSLIFGPYPHGLLRIAPSTDWGTHKQKGTVDVPFTLPPTPWGCRSPIQAMLWAPGKEWKTDRVWGSVGAGVVG